MQPGSPYQVVETLGTSPVGTVWSATDGAGGSVTLAVLATDVAADPRWRNAFAAAVNSLAEPRPGEPLLVDSNLNAPTPWAAFGVWHGPGAERVFEILGATYHPATPKSPTQPVAPESQPTLDPSNPFPAAGEATLATPWATSGPPRPSSGPPFPAPDLGPPLPTSTPPVSASPTSGYPTYPTPRSPAESWPPTNDPPPFGSPYPPVSGHPPLSSASPARQSALPSGGRRRNEKLILVISLVALALASGTAFVAWRSLNDNDQKPTPTGSSSVAAPVLSASPLAPGVEPPRPGTWPDKWPQFGPKDKVQALTLKGLGFTLTVPSTWDCVPGGSAPGYAKYTCGASLGNNVEVGGDVVVRDCPKPCDEDRRTTMREYEEAWGAQWRAGGDYATLAEKLNIDGEQRYGLVVVGYWRSTPGGTVDRQVVLRMTAPEQWVDQIRQVANGVRDNAAF